MTNDQLIDAAASVVRAREVDGRLIGDVGAALITESGALHVGVCIDTTSGTGFCAEASAIAAMVTTGESRIAMVVAVWKDEAGSVTVLPPCGRCREFIKQIDPANIDARVVVGPSEVVTLRELLPRHEWPT